MKIENVYYRYKKSERDVLKGISANFEGGKCYAVVGPSGSGKTTLLSLMAGLDRPTSGNIEVAGQDLSKMDLSHYRREHVSMIFQSFQLFPLLTAVENVSVPMEIIGRHPGEARKSAVTLLEKVGIDNTKHKRYPANLSGGEQQRVAIARSLSSGAKLLLADEPTGNLDKENGNAITEILRSLAHESGLCVIIVTHNQELAAICDVVYRISDGNIAV